MQRYSLRPPAYPRPHVRVSAGFPGRLGFLGNPSPVWYPVDTSSVRRTRPGYSVPGCRLPWRAGPHCSPGDVRGCTLEHALPVQPKRRNSSSVSRSVLDQAHNLRRLVLPNDDSRVSSSCLPLLHSARREVQEGSAGPPFPPASRIEGQSLPWGECVTPASGGEEVHLYTIQVIKDLFSLSPSSLMSPPFRGNGSQDRAVEVNPASLHF
jgi:hypothetical protein